MEDRLTTEHTVNFPLVEVNSIFGPETVLYKRPRDSTVIITKPTVDVTQSRSTTVQLTLGNILFEI